MYNLPQLPHGRQEQESLVMEASGPHIQAQHTLHVHVHVHVHVCMYVMFQ